ncbi:MAG: hypothetical protein AB9835_03815 [Eubacteriales bacterium]
MPNDIEILRSLAEEYALAASHPRNAENDRLYRAVNGLRMVRPVVLIDEEPWCELNGSGELDLLCADGAYRHAEHHMRRMLYKWRHHPADMIIPPFIPVHKMISGDSGWFAVKEETVATDSSNHIISHEYEDQLSTPEDIDRLRLPKLRYEEEATRSLWEKLSEAIGDIVPVRITGHSSYICPWDNIAMYRGVTNLLIDLVDRPEHTHAVMEKITSMYEEQFRQYEELGLFEGQPYTIHCAAGLCDELGAKEGEPVLRKNVWGRGMAQILASVSSDMHEEFEIEYQKRLMAPFGLVYYGCCEPLDKKIDILKKIPRLRKVSITPWADVNVAAEAIRKDYVLALKPNPANVGVGFDKGTVRKEIEGLLSACQRHGCSCEITLKDISTVAHSPRHLEEWEQVVMDIVKG